MSIFPTSDIKSNGSAFPNQNRKTGPFTGKFKALRPIQSNTSKTVFAVLEIEVPGEVDVFQDYLNFNELKAEKSIGFLVSHCKAALRAAGETVDNAEEHDLQWVEEQYTKLVNEHKTVRFEQSVNANNQLTINYIG